MGKSNRDKIAAILRQYMDASDLLVKDVAEAIGQRANYVSMMRQGVSQIPIATIRPLCETLKIDDPAEFARLCLTEYAPDMLSLMDWLHGQGDIEPNERAILKQIRALSGGKKVRLTKKSEDELAAFIEAALN